MPLPEPILDDLRFQKDLVDEARKRIIRYCPEWTDYNLSDPGITLIELFAWMTELLTYRLNRVPEKTYIRFLNMLDVHLQPPSSARAKLTFWLSVPFPVNPGDTTTVVVPQYTEVATPYFEGQSEVIFTTDTALTIYPPRLFHLRRSDNVTTNYLERLKLKTVDVFSPSPREGECFYLGFDPDQNIAGHILQLTFECVEDHGTGIQRKDPPLVWSCSMGRGLWQEIAPSTFKGEEETTGGLNTASGHVILYLPLEMQCDEIHGQNGYWVRCMYETRRPEQGHYNQSPRIKAVAAHSRGGAVWATHALMQQYAILGVSNGEPGQIFKTQHSPLLQPADGETVEVEELCEGELTFVPWQWVPDFSFSEPYDRHFTLELATGEIVFGPAIRQPNGAVRQYGRVPESGRQVRFSRYRYGGGASGNVPPGKLQVLHSTVAYITRVTNLEVAQGGSDQELLAEAQMRARREMRAQNRAVTVEDFEHLTVRASANVARVKCLAPSSLQAQPSASSASSRLPGSITLLIVPAAVQAVAQGDYAQLLLGEALIKQIQAHLDQYRLLTTTVEVREPRYFGVKVCAEVVPLPFGDLEVIQSRVVRALQRYLAPLPLPNNPELSGEAAVEQTLGAGWQGWPFGRALYLSELFSFIQQVPGVKHVLTVTFSYRSLNLRTMMDAAAPPGTAEELVEVTQRGLEIPEDGVLCSLDHDVKLITL